MTQVGTKSHCGACCKRWSHRKRCLCIEKEKTKCQLKSSPLDYPDKALKHFNPFKQFDQQHQNAVLFNLFIYHHLLVIYSFLLTHKFVTHPEHKASLFVRSKHIDDLYSLMTQLRISCQQLGQAQIKQTSHFQINISASVCLHHNTVQGPRGKPKLQDLEAGNPVSYMVEFTINMHRVSGYHGQSGSGRQTGSFRVVRHLCPDTLQGLPFCTLIGFRLTTSSRQKPFYRNIPCLRSMGMATRGHQHHQRHNMPDLIDLQEQMGSWLGSDKVRACRVRWLVQVGQ